MVTTKQQIQSYLPFLLFIALLVFCYFIVRPFLIAIFLGALLAYMLYPVFKWLNKKTKKPNLNAFLLCILVLIIIIAPFAYFTNVLVNESYTIYLLSKQKLATGFFQNCESSLCDNFKDFLKMPNISYHIEQASKTVTNYIIEKGSNFLIAIPGFIINIVVFFFTLFYFLRDGKDLVDRVGYYLSLQQKKYITILSRLKEATHGIVYGYILVATMQGFLGGLGFLILGVPSPFFWAVVMGLFALIPFLGTGIIWLPAAIIMIINGMTQDNNALITKGIILIAYGAIIVSGLDNLVRPKLIGDKAKIHPALILVGILGGLYFFGPLGVIIGPIVLSLTAIIVETYLGEKPSQKKLKEAFKGS
jgi:predicted PurR-regulated permease PerM